MCNALGKAMVKECIPINALIACGVWHVVNLKWIVKNYILNKGQEKEQIGVNRILQLSIIEAQQ